MRLLLLLVLLLLGMGLTSKVWAEDTPGPSGQGARPNLKGSEVVGIKIIANDPQYVEPEVLEIRPDPKTQQATLVYSGLEVQGQEQHRWGERPSGKKVIPRDGFNQLAGLILKDDLWFTPCAPENMPSINSGSLVLQVTIRPRKAGPGAAERTITVSSNSFKEEKASKEFLAIVQLAGQLYGVDMITRAEYD